MITDTDTSESVDFYVHREYGVLSRFPAPPEDIEHEYKRVSLPAASAPSVISRHGDPWYIKIDIEFYDQVILRFLFRDEIFPDYISAESHNLEVLALLLNEGGYSSFKLVDGISVSHRFSDFSFFEIDTKTSVSHSFSFHPAEPFGNDIPGPQDESG